MFRWTVHLNGTPVEEEGSSAVAVEDKVYAFARGNVKVFNTVSLRWRTLPPVTPGRGECPFEGPSMCYVHPTVLVEDIIYIWVGYDFLTRENYSVLNAFDVDTHRWFKPKVSGTVPEGRNYHSACVLGKVIFIHGGYNQMTGYSNDIHKLDTTTMVWSLINTGGTPPPALWRHSATIIGTKMFVFGGWGDQCNNIRVFDTETNCWLNTPSAQILPKQRGMHSAFAYNGELYIYGGFSCAYQIFTDLWKFNSKTFSWKKVEPKGEGPPQRFSMCCCMLGDRIILCGGRETPYDLYILDLSPSLKTLCKLAVIQYRLEQSRLPHNIRWELAALTTNSGNVRAKVYGNRKLRS